MATPHISAKVGDIAKTVIFCGDPLRAKMIAEKFLDKDSAKLVSSVRNIYAYTGTYNGKPVSVMGHGMGISSVAIYAHELYAFYGVERIVRVGSAGSYQEDVKVMDVVVATSADSDSNFGDAYDFVEPSIDADKKMLDLIKENSKSMSNVKYGKILSSQWFYAPAFGDRWKDIAKEGVLCVEMEGFALYVIAQHFGKEALCLVTISDSLVTGESLTPEKRQNSFKDMVLLALDSFVK